MEALNGTNLGGRNLTVNEARPKTDRPRREGGGGGRGGGFGRGGGVAAAVDARAAAAVAAVGTLVHAAASLVASELKKILCRSGSSRTVPAFVFVAIIACQRDSVGCSGR